VSDQDGEDYGCNPGEGFDHRSDAPEIAEYVTC
jgi:hypothetical protein